MLPRHCFHLVIETVEHIIQSRYGAYKRPADYKAKHGYPPLFRSITVIVKAENEIDRCRNNLDFNYSVTVKIPQCITKAGAAIDFQLFSCSALLLHFAKSFSDHFPQIKFLHKKFRSGQVLQINYTTEDIFMSRFYYSEVFSADRLYYGLCGSASEYFIFRDKPDRGILRAESQNRVFPKSVSA